MSVVVFQHRSYISSLKCVVLAASGINLKQKICMQNGQSVESVIMRHDATAGLYAGGPRQGSPRATLCVSSQVC